MRSHILRAFAGALLAAAVALPAAASDAPFKEIGNTTVGPDIDVHHIDVRGTDGVNQIRVCVRRAMVRFVDLSVTYDTAGLEELKIKPRIGQGECSRNINLRGENRKLVRISIAAQTVDADEAVLRVSAR
ncbi:MAG: hypothetical protein AAGF45_09770 [Pseudomonadota bacterium]